MKKPKSLSSTDIARYAGKYHIPADQSYLLDSSYFNYVFSLDTTQFKEQQKNHYQPLQALYYDKDGNLVSFHINCYAGGFPNLKWNRNGILDTFLPHSQTPPDSMLPLSKQLVYIKTLDGREAEKSIPGDNDYVVVVYWNHFLTRQSKRFIRYIKYNCTLVQGKKVKLLFVNDDNLFSETESN
ncbi:MAG TPA: hypothetical protein VE978_01790 [Chitinophagales bacterium]|nr:hypothetical protein [Chitinophagales bacterium]